MRGLASCYNEHAIRVSDSYCSRPSTQSFLSPKLTHSTRYSVSSVYKVNLTHSTHKQQQQQLLLTLTWTKKLVGQAFTINVTPDPDSNSNSNSNDPRELRKSKGDETFTSQNLEIRVLWDLCGAKYDELGPEPVGGFYVVVLVGSELCLRLGDKDAPLDHEFDSGRSFWMVSRSERFCGGASVYAATRAKFSEAGTAHEIMIKCGAEEEGLKKVQHQSGHVLSVCMDEKRIFEVRRLRWNFRGNQTIFVDGLVVDMMWDLHDWLFGKEGSAVFMFRTRSGLDSRLWLERHKVVVEEEEEHDGKVNAFSLLICANCKNPD